MFLAVLILAVQTVAPADAVAPKTYAARLQAASDLVSFSETAAARAELDGTELSDRGFEWMHLNLEVELARSTDAGPGLVPHGRRAMMTIIAPRPKAVSRMFGASATLRAVAVSPKGDRIAAGGSENDIHVWNARTGDPERLYSGHTGPIVGLVFSRDGRRLASGSADGSAILWETADGRPAMTLRAGGEALTAIAWSANNEWFATADKTFGVRVWFASNSEARFVARGHSKQINGLAFSPDGKYIASASDDGSVRLVELKNGDVVRVFAGDGMALTAIVFEADSAGIRVATADGSLRRLDVESGAQSGASVSAKEPFTSLVQSADTRRFVTGSESGTVRFFDADGKLLFLTPVATGPVCALAFDAQSSRLLACGEDHVLYALETDATLARALQRANPSELPDDEAAAGMKPLAIDALCRRVVERPGLAPETYMRAETLGLAAAARGPALGQIQSTIGGAVYRQGRFEDALGILTTAGEMRRGWPPNLAFRAMTLAKLGRITEARDTLERLEILMREKRWESDLDLRAVLEETRSVVASAKPVPK